MSKCHCVGGPDERTTLPGFGVIVGDAILPQVAHDGRVRPNNRTQENHKKRKHQRGKKKKWNQAICTRVQKYKLIPLFFFSLTLDSFLWKAETEKKLKKEIQATENENCAGGGQSDSFPSVQIFTEGSIHLLQRRTPTCEPTRPHQPWDTPFKFRNGEISWRRIHKSSKWINWNWLIENKIPRTITA